MEATAMSRLAVMCQGMFFKKIAEVLGVSVRDFFDFPRIRRIEV